MPRTRSGKRRPSSFRPPSCRATTASSTASSRSSASATTTTSVARCEAAVQQQFGAQVSAARSQPHYLDVTHPTANKGVVVERLSHYFKIPLEQIATLGDQPNDVLMFKRSGLSIAMGNASEEVQRQATYVTDSNEDEGFAKAIEGFILPRVAAAPAAARAG